MKFIPYISFEGNTKEALEYYTSIFGGEYTVMYYKDAPPNPNFKISDEDKDKIMHGELRFNDNVIYFSDSLEIDKFSDKQKISLVIDFDSEKSIEEIYNKFIDGGTVQMPLHDAFWGAKYATVVDKLGVLWSLNFTKSK